MTRSPPRLVPSFSSILHELWRDGNGWILIAVSSGWFLSVGLRYAYPSLLPFFRAEFGFDLTMAGVLLSVLWVAYALGQFPGGLLGDQVGEGRILVISTALSAIAILAVATAPNQWLLFVGSFAFGIATSLYGPTRFTIFTDIYATRAGTAIGLTMSAGSIGNTLLPAITATIATVLTWRLGFGALVPLFAGVALALWIAVPARTSPSVPSTTGLSMDLFRRLYQGISSSGIPAILAIEILLVFVIQGFLGFYPTYLIEIKAFTPQTAATIYGAYFAIGILIQPITGLSRDRFGSKRTLALIILVFFAGLIAIHFATSVLTVLLVTILLSHHNGSGVVINTFIADALAADIKGAGLGLLRTTWLLIGALSPIMVGYLGDLGHLQIAFYLLAGLAGLALVLTIIIPTE